MRTETNSKGWFTLILFSLLLCACVTGSNRFDASPRRSLRLDTESVARLRHASALGSASSTSGSVTAASTLARIAPLLLVMLRSDDKANALHERLQECVSQAEQKVNASFLGDREPTRDECGEELDVDGCGEPVTRAMLLGSRKHLLALACSRQVLQQLWPASFSVEQRYRYYRNARFLETISQEEERRLIEQGCTRELWRTIKPDIVLHSNSAPLTAVLIIDFKFPCPPTNTPTWKRYGRASAYAGLNQGEVYKEALGGEALLLSPRGIFP
jgi:hypothetical protein